MRPLDGTPKLADRGTSAMRTAAWLAASCISAPPLVAGPQAPAGGDPAPAPAPAPASVERPLEVDGTWSASWRLRRSGEARDQDLVSVLAFDVGRADADRVHGRFLGRITADLDGRADAESQEFGSLQDTYDDPVHLDLYEASVAIERAFGGPGQLRLGRQFDYATPEYAHYDGARFESGPLGAKRVVAGAYAGVPVRLYDATSLGDRIAGIWTEARPWKGGRARADWLHVDQDESGTGFHDDLLALSVWHRFHERLAFDAAYSRLEDDDRDVRARATYEDPERGWTVVASYYRLLTTQRDFAYEFDPFFSTLQEYRPFGDYRLLVAKSLSDEVRLEVGADVRELDDAEDENTLNHDYDREWATLVLTDLLARDLDLSLTGDRWSGSQQDAETWGLDATWRPSAEWRASAGSAYLLYRYDVENDVEREDVRVWYARVRKRIGAEWSFDLVYEYEHADPEDFHDFRGGITWRF